MQKKIIIAASSARAYTERARVYGYEVVALDGFGDADLRSIASETYQVKMQDWQVDAEDFKQQFSQINLEQVRGFCYGSLFDSQPELLNWVAARVPIIGNHAKTLKIAKSFYFFELLDSLDIPHPEVRLDFPNTPDHWLAKSIGGSGGMHIRHANQYGLGDYYQQEIIGIPVSMLFLANVKETQLIGFNRQLISPTLQIPYRYAGAVSNVKLPDSVVHAFCSTAEKLTNALGLVGVNTLDAVLCDETLSILELNPRLSASFELYPNLWDAHLNACNDILIGLPVNKGSRAKMTIYADSDIEIDTNLAWPDWTSDRPNLDFTKQDLKSTRIFKDAPVCTVLSEAETAELAYEILQDRAKQLREMMI